MSNGGLADTQSVQNQASEADATAVYSLGDIIAGLTDTIDEVQPWVALINSILGFVGTLQKLRQPDPPVSALESVNKAIHDVFLQLGAIDAAGAILDRTDKLHDAITPALDSLDEVQNSVNDPSTYPPGSLITSNRPMRSFQ
jgi:hypothetical protein